MNLVRIRCLVVSALLAAGLALGAASEAHTAASQGLVVVVNDVPITDYDVDQRMRFKQALGFSEGGEAEQRKAALQDLIDDVIKKTEAKRHQIEPNQEQIEEAIARMAASAGTTVDGLSETLREKGVATDTLEQYVEASIAFNAIATNKYNVSVNVDDSEIEKRLASMRSDPRFKPVQVYEVQEIALPLEETSESMMGQLLQARAVEAQQIVSRFNGCDSAKAATSGIYNVQVGEVIQVPADQMPEEMKQALDQAGSGNALGPMRTRQGVQVVGFCGRRTIEPPQPDRDMVESMLRNEKYQRATERILRSLRRNAYIDYKDGRRADSGKPREQAQTAVKPKQASQEDDALRQRIEMLQQKIDALESQ